MGKYLLFLFAFCLAGLSQAAFSSNMGFYASLDGTVDFADIKIPNTEVPDHKGTGFGVYVTPGIRFGSTLAIGPFAMFSSISDRSVDSMNYLLSGYGGELKLRVAPLNLKGGYGLYVLDITKNDVKTGYRDGAGWHAGAGFEALLGPGLTMHLDYKYSAIRFRSSGVDLVAHSAVIGVTSYF